MESSATTPTPATDTDAPATNADRDTAKPASSKISAKISKYVAYDRLQG